MEAGGSYRGWAAGSVVASRVETMGLSRAPRGGASTETPGCSCNAGSPGFACAGAVGGGAFGTKPWSSASSTSAVLSRRRARRGAGAAAVTVCASSEAATDLTGGCGASDATAFLRVAGFALVLPATFAARGEAWCLPAVGAGALARLRAREACGEPSETSATGGATATAWLVEAFRRGAAARAAGALSGAFRRARAGAGLRGMGVSGY